MGEARSAHVAVRLDGPRCRELRGPSYCGKVLVAGGVPAGNVNARLRSAELFDPAAGNWVRLADMVEPRHAQRATGGRTFSATLLDGPECTTEETAPPHCGKVLVAGGSASPRSAEIYDPDTDTWNPTGLINEARTVFSADLLSGPNCGQNCGKVLIIGHGFTQGDRATGTAELYDPRTGQWTVTEPMPGGNRTAHATAVLAGPECQTVSAPDYCGKVLVVGGHHYSNPDPPAGDNPASDTTLLFDPAATAQPWELGAELPKRKQQGHDAVLLSDGRVLVAGGCSDAPEYDCFASEIYDPATRSWAETGRTSEEHNGRFLTRLPDGRVLAAGSASAEVYDQGTGSWRTAGSFVASRFLATATALGCESKAGAVLIAGGYSPGGVVLANAEAFDASPTITGLNPDSGTSANGVELSIEGYGFRPYTSDPNSAAEVRVGSETVVGTVNADGTRITLTTPVTAELGPVDVEVVVGGLPARSCGSTTFTYTDVPSVDRIEPESGPATGGRALVVYGKGMFEAVLTIDGIAVPVTVDATGTTMTAVTPPHAPGPVALAVANSVGAATAVPTFTYTAAFAEITPRKAGTRGGDRVLISGKGLDGAIRVSFGDETAEIVEVSDERIEVLTPAHSPGQVRLTVETPTGSAVPADAGDDVFDFVTSSIPSLPEQGSPVGAGGTSANQPQGSLPGGGGGNGGGPAPFTSVEPALPPGSAPTAGSNLAQAPPVVPSVNAPAIAPGAASTPSLSPTSSATVSPVAAAAESPGLSVQGSPNGPGAWVSPSAEDPDAAPRYTMIGSAGTPTVLAALMAGGAAVLSLTCTLTRRPELVAAPAGVPVGRQGAGRRRLR